MPLQVRTLELLKLRFGESALRMCDVMLKDIADSKRVDANIKADSRGSANGLEGTSATIISAVFWPPLGGALRTDAHFLSLRRKWWALGPRVAPVQCPVLSLRYPPRVIRLCLPLCGGAGADTTDFTLPESVEGNLSAYWKRFHAIKARVTDDWEMIGCLARGHPVCCIRSTTRGPHSWQRHLSTSIVVRAPVASGTQAPRKLVWKKNLGTVRLKLTIGGADREFSVSPLHARCGAGGRAGGDTLCRSNLSLCFVSLLWAGESSRRKSVRVVSSLSSPFSSRSIIMRFEDRDKWGLQELAALVGAGPQHITHCGTVLRGTYEMDHDASADYTKPTAARK